MRGISDYLNGVIKSNLKGDVAKYVEKIFKQEVAKTVYGVFAVGYAQRGELGKSRHFKAKVTDCGDCYKLMVYNDAPPNTPVFPPIRSDSPTIFSEWIDEGEWLDLGKFLHSHGAVREKRSARPFIQNTQRRVDGQDSEKIYNMIINGLGRA